MSVLGNMNRTVRVSGGILLAIAMLSLILPWISPNDYSAVDLDNPLSPPSFEGMHWFGTDDLGRDQLVRTMHGIKITMIVAIIASVVSLVIGVAWGATAGYVGGRVDAVMMRAVDGLYAVPFLFFVILLMVVFDNSFMLIFVAIGAINWLDMARIVRGQTLSLREREFVKAARLMGVSTPGIIFRHIAPNLIGVVIVYLTLTIPAAILVESFLSFVGLGIQPPSTSLGSLVSRGLDHLETASWVILFPALLLASILMCFNFLGDGLRDQLDVRQEQ